MSHLFRLLFFTAVVLFSGCSPRTFTKSYYVKYFATTGNDRFIAHAERTNNFYFMCFDQGAKEKKDLLRSIGASCAYGYDWVIKDDIVRGEDTLYTDKISYCSFSRYFSENFSNLNKNKIDAPTCKTGLLMYVISNKQDTDNTGIFELYYDATTRGVSQIYLEIFKCFDRSKADLERDLGESIKAGLDGIGETYYGKYPGSDIETIDSIMHKNADVITKDFLRRITKYYSTRDLDAATKGYCERHVAPLLTEIKKIQ